MSTKGAPWVPQYASDVPQRCLIGPPKCLRFTSNMPHRSPNGTKWVPRSASDAPQSASDVHQRCPMGPQCASDVPQSASRVPQRSPKGPPICLICPPKVPHRSPNVSQMSPKSASWVPKRVSDGPQKLPHEHPHKCLRL